MPNPRTRLERVAANHHGVILRADAIRAGLTPAQIDRRVRRRQWVPGPKRGAFILREFVDNPLSQLKAAIDAVGPDAIAWGHSALALYGMANFPLAPAIASRRRITSANLAPVIVGDLADLHTTKRQGIRTASLALAIASVAGSTTPADLDELVDSALRQRLTTWPRLEAEFRLMCGRGRAGSSELQRLLVQRSKRSAVPLSRWSRDMARKLIAAGLPNPELEWRISTTDGTLIAQVDLAYPQSRYAIELDSLAYHHNQTAFQEDRSRDASLLQCGWRVSRFTWRQFADDWPFVETTVRAGLHPS